MKKNLWIALLLLVACTGSQGQEVLSPKVFQKKLDETKHAFLLDVRTPEEVANGKIEGASNVVFDSNFAGKLSQIPKQPIFVYCAGGIRSAKAAKVLRNNGYAQVFELEGGFSAWKEAKLQVK
ncbi:MAG: rhodanese-like domain-containing protein [Cytophagales bacterium]